METMLAKLKQRIKHSSPPRLLAIGFALVILTGDDPAHVADLCSRGGACQLCRRFIHINERGLCDRTDRHRYGRSLYDLRLYGRCPL